MFILQVACWNVEAYFHLSVAIQWRLFLIANNRLNVHCIAIQQLKNRSRCVKRTRCQWGIKDKKSCTLQKCQSVCHFLRENPWEVSLKHNPNSWCTFVKELWFTLRVIHYWGGLSFTGFSLILEVQSDNKCAHTQLSGTSWTHWLSVVLKTIINLS